jgi:hypothetical protein
MAWPGTTFALAEDAASPRGGVVLLALEAAESFPRQSPHRTTLSWRYFFAIMGSCKKPDPELLPVHRPLCPKCQKRMTTTAVSDGPEGFERRRFECLKCTVTEIRMLASDPIKSDALRWLSGELRRPD